MKNLSHQNKSPRKRQAYYKAVQTAEYEPTVDDSLPFPVSDDGKSDYSTSTQKRSRPPKTSVMITEHIRENWIKWFVAIISTVVTIFTLYFGRDLGKVEAKVEGLSTSISELKGDVKSINDKVHVQDLSIQKNQLGIESLQKKK